MTTEEIIKCLDELRALEREFRKDFNALMEKYRAASEVDTNRKDSSDIEIVEGPKP